MSEIDKIFASKPSASSKSENLSSKKRSFSDSETVVDTSADLTGPPKRRKKNNKKKEKDPSTTSKRVEESPSERRPLPETVVDTSADLAGPSKLRKMDKKNTRVSKKKKGIDFEDSRGSGDRRKTEEGWSVYKEEELGLNDEGGGERLNDEGGDTPLCPFDCNCCF